MPPQVIAAGIIAGGTIVSASIASKAAKKASGAQQEAIVRSEELLAESRIRAAELISGGQHAAAAAAIQAAKVQAKAIMDATELSIDAQERFFAIADKKLEPFRQQGLVAQEELASMLGIPNAQGQLVPYDAENISGTPGYKALFLEGTKAVERSAVGTKLSGAQVKAQQQFGQGIAERYYQTRVADLMNLTNIGRAAAGDLAQAATGTGRSIGQTYMAQGGQLSDVYGQQGATLADVYSGTANTLAALENQYGANLTNLALASGQNTASLYAQQGNIWGNAMNNLALIAGLYGSKLNPKAKTKTKTKTVEEDDDS